MGYHSRGVLCNTQKIPPDLSYAVGEVCGIDNQGDQNWQIEPDKSLPFSEKETDPIKRENEIRRLEILRKLFLLVLVEGSDWLRNQIYPQTAPHLSPNRGL